jgi:uncharacterized protein YceK
MALLIATASLCGCASVGYYTRPSTTSLNAYLQTAVLYDEAGTCYLRLVYKDNAQSRITLDRAVCDNARTVIAATPAPPPAPKPAPPPPAKEPPPR